MWYTAVGARGPGSSTSQEILLLDQALPWAWRRTAAATRVAAVGSHAEGHSEEVRCAAREENRDEERGRGPRPQIKIARHARVYLTHSPYRHTQKWGKKGTRVSGRLKIRKNEAVGWGLGGGPAVSLHLRRCWRLLFSHLFLDETRGERMLLALTGDIKAARLKHPLATRPPQFSGTGAKGVCDAASNS